jgi:L-asparaginase
MVAKSCSGCAAGSWAWLVLAIALASCSLMAHAQGSPGAAGLPQVVVLSTGGTIAGRGESTTTLSGYKAGQVLGSQLIEAVPEIKQHANVRVEQIVNIGSGNMTIAVWLRLAERINQIFSEEASVAGVVITHGTNTLEETAYFLNLTVKHDKPVVLVGSQRPATAISADGPLNLLNAVRVAASPAAVGKGAMIVMNDEINAARDVTKTNTFRVETFNSGELGFLGYVDSDEVAFYRMSTKRHTARSEFDVRGLTTLPKVEIIYTYAEAGLEAIKAVAPASAGVVFVGTGAGGLSNAERAAIKSLGPVDSRAVMVLSKRPGNGRVVARKDYDAEGFIPGDNLNPQKARILLMLALTKTRDLGEIRRMFREY